MVQRCHIRIGDLTTAQGIVVSASSMLSVDGKKVALEGDKISCPSCKGTGVIVCDGPRLSDKWEGKYFALENDICACKCSPPPRLLPSQKRHFQTIEGSGVASSVKSQSAQSLLKSVAGSGAAKTIKDTYDQHFVLRDHETDTLFKNQKYRITTSLGIFEGITDESGLTGKVGTASKSEEITVEIFGA